MFRRIRSRLTVAFAVPLALLLVVTAAAAWSSYRGDRSVTREANLAIAANGPSGIVNALQNERNEATADMVGVAAEAHLPVSSNADARRKTDQSLAAFRASIEASGASTRQVFQPALNALAQLPSVRRQVDAFKGDKSLGSPQAKAADVAAFDRYSTLIDGFLGAIAGAPQHMSDPTLRSSVETLDLLLNQSESLTVLAQQMFALSILQSGPHAGSTIPAADLGAYQVWTSRLSAYTSGPDGPVVAGIVQAANRTGQAMLPFVKDATAGKPLDVIGFTEAIGPATTAKSGANVWQQAASSIGNHISQRAAALRHQATVRVIGYSAGALGSVVLGLAILLLVSRSISRPLTRLAGDARRIAEVDLPASVEAIFDPESATASPSASDEAYDEASDEPAHSKRSQLKEVTEVAGALDDVRRKALELATEQAALRHKVGEAFVNLGRRNQNLVVRQLELITQIEREEEDPATLEDLFRLDHLATRLRRHAESLLVIAGSGALRSGSEAASAVDVVRAASAEVEDYQRLRLHHFDHAVVSASVTTDLVHILAELMENALAFSPPHASVGLHGRALESGYTISVVDAGIGMSAEAREESNRRLASGGDLSDAASRHLGLVVAGRLAARHGISVTLHDSEPGGIAARIQIPAGLIESSVASPAGLNASPVAIEPPVSQAQAAHDVPSHHQLNGSEHPAVTGADRRLAAPAPAEDPTPVTHLSSGAAPAAGTATGTGAVAPPPLPRRIPPPSEAAVPMPAGSASGPAFASESGEVDRGGAHFAGGGSLPRRVPGAALPGADDALRRNRTPSAQTPWAVSSALSDYLTNHAEPPTGRPSTEGQ
ncbi:MAG TPA: nitrate- and nitrite sensing domain-containing protein [Acidimicrobiales bacterium]|nr:nitrate- and nitrite sensing domain-containing protein [Acidimicrobiales bacterium]